ncbi:MAG: hypothetical protein R3C11_03685 [Planctomycetaceae bacterium]
MRTHRILSGSGNITLILGNTGVSKEVDGRQAGIGIRSERRLPLVAGVVKFLVERGYQVRIIVRHPGDITGDNNSM